MAHIVEVFSGIQGEGIYVGRRHLFVRFGGCNLSCVYCDTPAARKPVPIAKIESSPGARRYDDVANPANVATLAATITRLDSDRSHDAISLTGGEPLLAADFIAELIPQCGGRSFYLETNGTLPRELEKVVGLVQTVAADIKLTSACGRAIDLNVARDFLSVASAREMFVKVTVADQTDTLELAAAAEIVASVGRNIPLVIQPVSPVSVGIRPPCAERLYEFQTAALRILHDVRVVPQVHRLMGWK